jgi:hypothetical protein
MINLRPLAVSRTEADLASELMAVYGADAAAEAGKRARMSRDKGNAIRFCTWRKAAALITLMDSAHGGQTLH